MSAVLPWLKVAAGLVAAAAAIVGWSLVVLQGIWLDALETKLAEARQAPRHRNGRQIWRYNVRLAVPRA